jgi:aspartate racemase
MIGVIGGNGVAATNKLCQLIEEKMVMEGAYRDAHHPEIIIWQATQAPSRSMYLEGRGPSWIEDYVGIGKKLKECGCTELCMCCNTAHYAVNLIEKEIGLPFINLLSLVAEQCFSLGVKRIGMMCSDGLRKTKLYDKNFEKISLSMKLIYPDEAFQELVTLGICNSKNKIRFEDKNSVKEHPYNCFDMVCNHLIVDKGVDCIVAGCTDIRNVYRPQI